MIGDMGIMKTYAGRTRGQVEKRNLSVLLASKALHIMPCEVRTRATKELPRGETMKFVVKHRWSFLSMLVTVGTALVAVSTIYYLHRRGMRRPESTLAIRMAGLAWIIHDFASKKRKGALKD